MLYNCDRMVLTHNNSSFYGLKWIDSLKFLENNLERFAQKESLLGVIDKKSGKNSTKWEKISHIIFRSPYLSKWKLDLKRRLV